VVTTSKNAFLAIFISLFYHNQKAVCWILGAEFGFKPGGFPYQSGPESRKRPCVLLFQVHQTMDDFFILFNSF
jgi:hypothetical protein